MLMMSPTRVDDHTHRHGEGKEEEELVEASLGRHQVQDAVHRYDGEEGGDRPSRPDGKSSFAKTSPSRKPTTIEAMPPKRAALRI
jgi:hypothetical protein